MKPIAIALAALAIVGCGAALADDVPRAPLAHPLKKMSLKACNRQADEHKLVGKARVLYIKECRTRIAPVNPVAAPAPTPRS